MKQTATVAEAIEILRRGGVGVLPTDTVYGLVARASDREAVKRLYALKRRERKPGTVIAASVEQLVELGVNEKCLKRVEHMWPNPLSVIVPAGENIEYIHQGLGDFPVRVPSNEDIRQLLQVTGALVTSSANEPGQPTSENISEAVEYFGDKVDFYVDGGELVGRAPSTIVRVSEHGALEVLRQGAVKVS